MKASLLLLVASGAAVASDFEQVCDLIYDLQENRNFDNLAFYAQDFRKLSSVLDNLNRRVNVPFVLLQHEGTNPQFLNRHFSQHTLTVAIFDELTLKDGKLMNGISWKFRRNPFVLVVKEMDADLANSLMTEFRNSLLVVIDESNAITHIYRLDLYPQRELRDLMGHPRRDLLRSEPVDNFQQRIERTPRNGHFTFLTYFEEFAMVEFFKFINGTWMPDQSLQFTPAFPDFDLLLWKYGFNIYTQHGKKYYSRNVTIGYPLNRQCNDLIIPRRIVPAADYALHPIRNSTAVVIALGVFYVALVLFVGYWAAGRARCFFDCWTESLFLTLGFPSPIQDRFNHNARFIFMVIYIILLILGFVLFNRYTALIGFYVRSVVYDDDIRSLDEFQEYGVKIKVIDQSDCGETQLSADAFELTSDIIYQFDIVTLNNKYAYCAKDRDWTILDYGQRNRHRQLFKNTEICMYEDFVSFVVYPDSDYETPLQRFTILGNEHGFWSQWKLKEKYEYTKRLFSLPKDEQIIQPFVVVDFKVLWYVLAVGLSLSAVAFGVELMIARMGHLRN